MTQFYGKTKICYGEDALETLEQVAAKQAFIVTDPFMVKNGFADRIKSHLDRAGIGHRVFDGVEPDPSLETVTRGVSLFMKDNADLLIAFGGGSSIDAAKAIAFFAHKVSPEKAKPMLVAIPTTSGTGSEVTAISVITDKVNNVKIPLNDEELIPDMAILDARFTRTLPAKMTAATGMDVLTHAIEAYVSLDANAFTSIYAKYAMRYVFKYLFRAYVCGDDMEAREHMLLGSCMAGMAFNNSGLGITHGVAHSLGGLFHIPHGLANAVILPHAIRFNAFDAGVKYREIAELLSLPASTVEEGVASLIKAVKDLNESMGIPNRISGLQIAEKVYRDSMDTIAKNVLDDICTAGNPRRPFLGDVKTLLEHAW
ncbi:1-propanol dehydrogenase PduQ [Desulfobaculum bizertense]|uniref:Alcohol dehydrogenase, class IV n=1 Tax=Desulfobaculum bizertense DSM 18034 TaxID=1121442 RepID=A0A1T4W4M3_9BACT|nr:1-propanol dehydrogenase PduQ [Desulfobaculum bizertense]UIJ38674.1 iron-containing alcohol dehydrogenase [Desulfobaculum bizertense]SKA72157.1 Alcohol dehydrogenase, class IV [Desulfobaculum bizertense DSM 18034]